MVSIASVERGYFSTDMDCELDRDKVVEIRQPVAPRGSRRPQPRLNQLKMVQATAVDAKASVEAEQWMHKRFSGLTLEHFGSTELVIYSTHEMEPPSSFKQVWHFAGPHHARGLVPADEARQVSRASIVLLFCDIQVKEDMQKALHIATSLCTLGEAAPPVILLPHSKSPESNSCAWGDSESRKQSGVDQHCVFTQSADNYIDEMICGEPSGFKMLCAVRSRINQVTRVLSRSNKHITHHRERAEYAHDLNVDVDHIVWEYLRVRLRTGIPDIDLDLEPGVPSSIDGALVGKELGRGSFGAVFKLIRPDSTETEEVVKMMDKAPMRSLSGLKALKRQLEIMQMLSQDAYRHENVVDLYEVYHTETHLHLVMEYAGSMDLYKRLKRLREGAMPLTQPKISGILQQCIAGLGHLHLVPRVAHRDLKPENIIISEIGDDIVVKLTDFDTAVTSVVCYGSVGTFPFTAPEVILEESYDPFPADIWSLAMVFLETVCCLDVVSKVLRLGDKAQQGLANKGASMLKIQRFFAAPGFSNVLLEKQMRSELATISPEVQTLIQGMMSVDAQARWTAVQLQESDVATKQRV